VNAGDSSASKPVSGLDVYTLTNALINEGVALCDLQARLLARGVSSDEASRVVNRVVATELKKKTNDRIAFLLARGETPEAIRARLFEEGFDPAVTADRVSEAVARHRDDKESRQSSGLGILGATVFVVGMLLYLGNKTGILPTFPLAGAIAMGLGGFLVSMAWISHR